VSRWFQAWKNSGTRALRRTGSPGRNCRLNPAQLKRVERALLQGAQANGFNSNLWTLWRVARVIERLTGVHYHPGHVWCVLRKMRWSLQRPAKRAKERNAEAVEKWKAETWPELKKARRTRGWLVFQDERSVSQEPPLRRTWATKGQTPIVVHSYNWKKMSISGTLAYRWDGKRARLYF
jgi:transposase